jgi:hypothetical protein
MEESAAGGARTDESSASLSSPSTIDPTPPPSPPSSPNQPLPSSLIELSPPSSPDPMDLFEQPDTFANVVQAASLDIARVNSSVVNAVAKIPKSFKQAKESPEWHEWKGAIEKELGMMKEKEPRPSRPLHRRQVSLPQRRPRSRRLHHPFIRRPHPSRQSPSSQALPLRPSRSSPRLAKGNRRLALNPS